MASHDLQDVIEPPFPAILLADVAAASVPVHAKVLALFDECGPRGGATSARSILAQRLLPTLVCDGHLSLQTAQREMAVSWIAAYEKYLRTDVPLPTHASVAPGRWHATTTSSPTLCGGPAIGPCSG